MARVETPGIIGPSKEGFIPQIPRKWKEGIAAVLGVAGAAGTGAIIWEITHQPAIAITEEISAQIPPSPGDYCPVSCSGCSD